MIIQSVLTLTISCNLLSYPNYTSYDLSGDYSEEARQYMEQNCIQSDDFDPNDILYRVIAKELENEINNQPQVDE